MSNWKRRGSVGICLWSLLLALVGVSQLIFGAYYIAKLPVFKIGSPVWVGFLVRCKSFWLWWKPIFDGSSPFWFFFFFIKNILCGAGLFGLHHKALELTRYWCPASSAASASVGGGGVGGGFVFGYGAETSSASASAAAAADEEEAVGRPSSSEKKRRWWRRGGGGGGCGGGGGGVVDGRLCASLGLSLVVVLLNLAHAVVCEVGEWQHWLDVHERALLRSAHLNHLALQGETH